jgi:anhydro-N-acetylmuramic acid kinase
MAQARLVVGAMSGTSADGVDVAVVRVGENWPRPTVELLRHHQLPYPAELKQRIFALRGQGAVALAELGDLGRDISLAYAQAVNEVLQAAGLSAEQIDAIAAHGQTLYHAPPVTIQWFDPALVAAQVGCAVVSDFRRADCAAGGQGAPLVPFADWVLFSHPKKSRVLLNLGGIANLTYVPASGGLETLRAFDTGPANCVSDWLCRTHDPAGSGFDADGAGAMAGSAHFRTAFLCARSQYVFARPPKSTDGPAMIDAYRQARNQAEFHGSFPDELATACLSAAHCVMMALDLFVPGWREGGVQEVLVSGGGMRNQCLMNCLREVIVDKTKVTMTEMDLVMAQAKEAVAFALLGAATLEGIAANVPSCTGARRAVVLGSVTPKP